MNLKRTTLISTFAIAAIAAFANTASAHGREHEEPNYPQTNFPRTNHPRTGQPQFGQREHEQFHKQEAARLAVQNSERKLRSERRLAKLERERRQVLRDYGIRSAEYRYFIARQERIWNDAVSRERRLMIEQRQAAVRRHEQYHLDTRQYAHLSIEADCIERDMYTQGVARFPTWEQPTYGNGYGNDNRRIPSRPNRPFDRRSPNNDVNVDWKFGVRVGN